MHTNDKQGCKNSGLWSLFSLSPFISLFLYSNAINYYRMCLGVRCCFGCDYIFLLLNMVRDSGATINWSEINGELGVVFRNIYTPPKGLS